MGRALMEGQADILQRRVVLQAGEAVRARAGLSPKQALLGVKVT